MRLRLPCAVCALCLLHLFRLGLGQYSEDYATNYYDDYQLYSAGYQYDENEDGFLFNPYTGSYDDVYGDYFFEDPIDETKDCRLDESGKPKINGTACDLKIEGADKLLKPALSGGLDGVYEASSCQNGLPMYKRKDSKANEQRVLWYSSEFRDWDVANGSIPKEDDILMFGGRGGRESRPDFVGDSWSIAAEFLKENKGIEEYSRAEVTVACADGSKSIRPAMDTFGRLPLASHEELEAQYKAVYNNHHASTSTEFNLGLITVLVMVGLGIVFGLPWLVAQNRRRRRGGAAGQQQGGLLSLIDFARKRGHTN